MYLKLLKNDFRKNPWNNEILLLFITFAAMITATAVLMLTQLFTSIASIGAMKAMGIPQKGIRDLYLGKICILAAAGCFLGFISALFTVPMLTGHISRAFGSQPQNDGGKFLSIPAVILLYSIILLFAGKILRRLEKATVIDLMVTENGFGRNAKVRDGLRRSKRLSVNLLMGLHEARRGYGIILGLLLIVSFLILIPFRTVQAMEYEDFVTYMGSPVCDLLLEVEQGDDLEERNQAAQHILLTESDRGTVANTDALRRVRLQAVGDDGEIIGIHIDSGKNAGAGLKYLVGESPKNKREIALLYTYFNRKSRKRLCRRTAK